MTVIRLGFEEKSIEEQLVGFAEYGLINHQNRYSYATVSNSYRPKKKILRLKVDKDDVSSLACTAFLLAQASEEHCLDRENILRGATIKLTGSQSLILIQDFVLKQFNERDIESIQIEVSGV